MTEHVSPTRLQTANLVSEFPAANASPWQGLSHDNGFFENEEIASLLKRGLFYARVGIPLHFRGAAGQGKTSLALEVAQRIGRPVTVMTGHDWLSAEDMIGKEVGQSTSTVVDRYVQSVRRTEKRVNLDWQDSLLAKAMEQGHTLVYDEFTRSSSAANGILLSVLEEGVLISTDRVNTRAVLQAHDEFRVILTSNPQEYAGVNAAPDALLDRMITFNMQPYSVRTESGIVSMRTGLGRPLASRIVQLVRSLKMEQPCQDASMRSAIMIARIAAARMRVATLSDTLLAQISADVLNGRSAQFTTGQILQQLARIAAPEEEIK